MRESSSVGVVNGRVCALTVCQQKHEGRQYIDIKKNRFDGKVGKVDVKFNEISLCYEEQPPQPAQERPSVNGANGDVRGTAEEGAEDTVQDSVSGSGVRSSARRPTATASVDESTAPTAENAPSRRVWIPRTVNHRTDTPGASSETKASPTLPGDDNVYRDGSQPQPPHEAEQQPAAAPKKYVEKRKWQRKEPVLSDVAAEVARLQAPEPLVNSPSETTHEMSEIPKPTSISHSPAAFNEAAQFWQLLHGTSEPQQVGVAETSSSRTSSWSRRAPTDKSADETLAQHPAREYKKAENGTPSPTTGAAQSAMQLPEAGSHRQGKRWSRNTAVQEEKAPHTIVELRPSLTPASIESSTAHDVAPLTTKKKKTASDAKVIQKPKSSKTKAARKLAQAEVSDGEPITWPKRDTALVVPEPAHLHALAVVEETPALAAEVALKPEHHHGGSGAVTSDISTSAARVPATVGGYNNAVSYQREPLGISETELAGAQRYASAVATVALMEPSEKKYQRGTTITVRKPAKAKTRKVVIKSA
jgi:hypothetical protein